MQPNQNKQNAVDAIWQNPEPLFGGTWKQRGNAWECATPNLRLLRTNTGNITVFCNHGTGQGGRQTDVFSYLQDTANTGDFFATLQYVAEVYGVELNLTDGQRQRVSLQRIARIIAPVLVESLKNNPAGVAARYLESRGFAPDGEHFGEWTQQTKAKAENALNEAKIDFEPNVFDQLGLTADRANNGYNLALPYYTDGVCVGFVLRDCTGTRTPKYLYSQGVGRPGYCDKLREDTGVFLVEGQFDALRVQQVFENPNVIATGGAIVGNELGDLLRRKNIRTVYYIPDLEYNEKGRRRTDLILQAIKAIQEQIPAVDREIFVIDLPSPDNVTSCKVDADSLGKNDPDGLQNAIQAGGVGWFVWELTNGGGVSVKLFNDVYGRATPYERGKIRNYIQGRKEFEAVGITPETCTDIDALNDAEARRQAVSEAVEQLKTNPTAERLAEIGRRLITAADGGTEKEFDEQLAITNDDVLADFRELTEPVQTRWELGRVETVTGTSEKRVKTFGRVEFNPATISIFAAATSHGKTTILLQSALDYVRNYGGCNPYGKQVLYISFEENRRQLFARSFKTFVNIDEEPSTFEYIDFGTHNRNSAINGFLREKRPYDFDSDEDWQPIADKLFASCLQYTQQITPKLRLFSLEGTDTDAVTAKITETVRKSADTGNPVGLVCIDYAQLLTSKNKGYSRTDEIKAVCKSLKRCAHDLEIPVLLAAQLNRPATELGIDNITVANLGESTEFERIADNVYLVWQVAKTAQGLYVGNKSTISNADNPEKTRERKTQSQNFGDRSWRLALKDSQTGTFAGFKEDCMYIEQMKARNGITGLWGLFPYDGERGFIGTIDRELMIKNYV